MPNRTDRSAPVPAGDSSVHPTAAELENSACPLCGATAATPHYRFPPYAVVRCAQCRLWYLKPRLAEGAMRGAYAHDSYFEGGGVGYSSYLAQEGTLRLTFRRFLGELARRGMAGGRLLEVGCAYGFFLAEAARSFSQRVGTDYSRAAVEMAQANADRVLLGGLEALGADDVFDCAAVIHVIEHIYDPRAFLTDLLAHVRPGGWVVLATPDMGSFWRPLQRYRWPFFKIPEHVTFFDRASLGALLEAVGCVEVQAVPYVSVFSLAMIGEKLGWRPPAALERLRFWLPGTTIAAAGRKPGATP